MLKCREIVAQSSTYLELEMPFGRRLEYRMHLLMCQHCRRFIRQFSAATQMTRQLSEPAVSSAEIEAVLSKIERLDE
ncbi:MAG: putative anti-sigma-YlaC factor YlaD [Motiliproteus sp.]